MYRREKYENKSLGLIKYFLIFNFWYENQYTTKKINKTDTILR
jgi:hypothetical protein